jgi:hypothetical protein
MGWGSRRTGAWGVEDWVRGAGGLTQWDLAGRTGPRETGGLRQGEWTGEESQWDQWDRGKGTQWGKGKETWQWGQQELVDWAELKVRVGSGQGVQWHRAKGSRVTGPKGAGEQGQEKLGTGPKGAGVQGQDMQGTRPREAGGQGQDKQGTRPREAGDRAKGTRWTGQRGADRLEGGGWVKGVMFSAFFDVSEYATAEYYTAQSLPHPCRRHADVYLHREKAPYQTKIERRIITNIL